MMVEIYGLHDPDTKALRYVGKAKCAQSRFKRHIAESRTETRPVCQWIAALIADGKLPEVRVLEAVPDDQWKAAERRLIAEHRKTSDLLNLAPGGDMPSQTREQRQDAARASWKAANSTPQRAAFNKAKRNAGRHLAELAKAGDWSGYYCMRLLMKCHAANDPAMYPNWATL
jgi:hypothetical protein